MSTLPKKILPHLYILELSQPMNICTEIINFFPLSFGPNILHALQISGLEIPDHRMADAFPTALLLSFWEYHIPFSGTDTLYQVQTSTQGWKGMFFHIQPHLPYSSALGKMHWSEPERMGFLLIFYQPLGTAPSHSQQSNRTQPVRVKTKSSIRIIKLLITATVPEIPSQVKDCVVLTTIESWKWKSSLHKQQTRIYGINLN